MRGIETSPLLQYVLNNGFCLVPRCSTVRSSNQWRVVHFEHDIDIEPRSDWVGVKFVLLNASGNSI